MSAAFGAEAPASDARVGAPMRAAASGSAAMHATGALVGALDTLALAGVLQHLDQGRRTGVLAVDAGDGVRRGLIRLRSGLVAAARFRCADGRELRDPVDAAAAMLALTRGRFTFAPDPLDVPSPPASGGLRVDTLLRDATCRAADVLSDGQPFDAASLDRRRPLERIPVLADDEPEDGADPLASPATMRAADWALLAAVDGRRTVAEVAAAAGQDPVCATDALDLLARAGLVRFAPARVESRSARSSGWCCPAPAPVPPQPSADAPLVEVLA